MPKLPFYAKGLRFECQGSGKCCASRGSYGYVYLNLDDQKRMARFFKLTRTQFLKQYCGKKDGHVHLLDSPDQGNDCRFLKDNRCSVYEARPEHCRTWPFWPENLKPKVWNTEIASFCPGVGKGKLYSLEEIRTILESQKDAES